MGLKQDIPWLLKVYASQSGTLAHNAQLFDISEGGLLKYVLADLKAQLSDRAFSQVGHRAVSINVLNQIVDKLSTLYAEPPVRKLPKDEASDTDVEMFEWYQTNLDINSVMGEGNEFFNLFKNTWVEPYFDTETNLPAMRVIPSDRFFVASNSQVSKQKPTHFVKVMDRKAIKKGKGKSAYDRDCTILWAYTAEEFLIFDDQGDVVVEDMIQFAELKGLNPYGRLPGVYINQSKHCLMPQPDSDTLSMTKLLPVCLSDMNFAMMYQCFSSYYGIDLDVNNLELGPNSFLNFKSDRESNKEPKIGILKPEVDTDKALMMVKSLLAMWMQSRGIKPGKMGDISAEDMASGIAKVIDEMDTSMVRQKQVSRFKNAEKQLWDLIMYGMHPVWSDQEGWEGERSQFTDDITVMVKFSDQKPLVNPADLIDAQVKKIDAGLESRRGAIKTLNPDLDEDKIDEKLKEIDTGRTVVVQVGDAPTPEPAAIDPSSQPMPAVSDVQKTALNGAQVTAMVEIVKEVANGNLPRESAIAILQSSFQLSDQEALDIVSTAGAGFTPRPSTLPFQSPPKP